MNRETIKIFEKPTQSYWLASTPGTDYPVLWEDINVDVAIVGGGISGILSAYFLAKGGLKVAVLEGDRILQGTTGHTTAKITSQHELIYNKLKNQRGQEIAKHYAEANESAIRIYEKLAAELEIDCDWSPQSAYVYTLEDTYVEQIQQEAATASALGIKASFLEEIPLPFAVKAAVRFDGQAQFHPRKFLLALAESLRAMGVPIYEGTRIMDLDKENGYVLKTDQGRHVHAEKVIIATHYPFYNKAGFYFARIYLERSYVIAIQAKENYPGGMYINSEEPARSFRSQPSEQGPLILIGGDHHKTGQGPDTTTHYEALVDYAYSLYTVESIPYRWSTQDCMTLDGIPYVGHYRADTPNLYIATGYGKWGMTNSMAAALLLRDLILDGRSPWQEVYDPSRLTLGASAKNFVVENLNVAGQLIEGKLSPLPDDAEVKPGEGAIIEAHQQRTGEYRDDQGTLHVVDTTCTHMGCEVAWNSAEKTWDCPCHGSRFSIEGTVVEGPALRPLQRNNDMNPLERLVRDEF